jgi:hypothetical protein
MGNSEANDGFLKECLRELVDKHRGMLGQMSASAVLEALLRELEEWADEPYDPG